MNDTRLLSLRSSQANAENKHINIARHDKGSNRGQRKDKKKVSRGGVDRK